MERANATMDRPNTPRTPTRDEADVLDENLEKLVGSVHDTPEDIMREEEQEQLPYEYSHEHDNGTFYRSAAKVYLTTNNCRLTMLAMCHGYSEFKEFLESDDLKAAMTKAKGKGSGSYGLDNLLLRKEACRRQYFVSKAFEAQMKVNPKLTKKDNPFYNPTSGKIFVPSKNRKRDELLTFLDQNRLDDNPKDLDFLRDKIQELQQEISETKEALGLGNLWEKKGWRGLTPWIRLCMVVDEDSLREAYLDRHDQKSRRELDGRKTDKVPESYWKKAADLFNDANWAPRSYPLEGWGECFENSHDLSWKVLNALGVKKLGAKDSDDIYGNKKGDKEEEFKKKGDKEEEFKKRYQAMKSNWDTIFERYMQSGEGKEAVSERQRARASDVAKRGNESDDDSSSSDSEALVAREPEGTEDVILTGGDRLDYLHDRPMQTMYFWYVLLVNGLLGRARSQVNSKYAVEGGHVPSVLPRAKEGPKSGQKGRQSLVSEQSLMDLEDTRAFRRRQEAMMHRIVQQGDRSFKQNEVGNLSLQFQSYVSDEASTNATLSSLCAESGALGKTIEDLEDTLDLEPDLTSERRKRLQTRLAEKVEMQKSLKERIGELKNVLQEIAGDKKATKDKLNCLTEGGPGMDKKPKSKLSRSSTIGANAKRVARPSTSSARASSGPASSSDDDASDKKPKAKRSRPSTSSARASSGPASSSDNDTSDKKAKAKRFRPSTSSVSARAGTASSSDDEASYSD
jgi:hypothetical protein